MSAAGIAAAGQRCAICGSGVHRPIACESGVEILQCRECRHVFSSFRADPHFDGFWGDVVEESDHSYWRRARRPMFEEFIDRFVAGDCGRLLDLGCGLGFFVKAVADATGWQAHGREIAMPAVRYARETLGLDTVTCGRLDATGFDLRSFDIITMWDVLDHVAEPDPLLAHCAGLLRPGGFCFIRTPNIAAQLARWRLKRALGAPEPGVGYFQARHHAHHFSVTSLRRLLERNGFTRLRFVHLRPVADAAGPVGRALKRGAYEAVRAAAVLTRGRLNLDNLFVLAYV